MPHQTDKLSSLEFEVKSCFYIPKGNFAWEYEPYARINFNEYHRLRALIIKLDLAPEYVKKCKIKLIIEHF